MNDGESEIVLEYLLEKRDYFLFMLKQIKLEKIQELPEDDNQEAENLEKEIIDNLNNINKEIQNFIADQKQV